MDYRKFVETFVVIEMSKVKFAHGGTTILLHLCMQIRALLLLDIMSRFSETQQTSRGKMGLSTGLKQIVQADWPYATGLNDAK